MNDTIRKLQRLHRQMNALGAGRETSAPALRTFASYSEFYRATLPPGWRLFPHIRYICEQIDDLVAGRITRLAISTPPGHGKSDTVTRRLPVYWAHQNPGDAVVLTGYNDTFAHKNLSKPARQLARELGILDPSATALDDWEFSNGSRLVARGVGSPPTGVNPISLIVIDDPIKSREQAESETIRQNVWDWWEVDLVQRFFPRTRVVVIQTRWHEDDLIGRLRVSGEKDLWRFVNLPALADPALTGGEDPLGREEGEALWPEAKPAGFLRQLRDEGSRRSFEALFQGNPTPREGAFFHVTKLKYCEASEVPPLLAVCRGWDLGATEGEGDYTAGVKVGADGQGGFYVLDVERGRWGSGQRDGRIKAAADRDGVAVSVRLPQDPGAAGKSLAESLLAMLAGYAARAEPVSGSKQTRADPFAAAVERGAVTVVRAEWTDAYVEELRQFDRGTHDDQVDASADAFNEVALGVPDFSSAF